MFVITRFYVNDSVKRHHAQPRHRFRTIEEAREYCKREDTHGGAYCHTHGLVSKSIDSRACDPAHCPHCGAPTVPAWFDGFTEV